MGRGWAEKKRLVLLFLFLSTGGGCGNRFCGFVSLGGSLFDNNLTFSCVLFCVNCDYLLFARVSATVYATLSAHSLIA